MANVNQEIRERKEVLRDLRNLFSEQYKASNQALKLIDRLLSRKRSLPTVEDLAKLVDAQDRVNRAFNSLTTAFSRADSIFETM